MGNGIVMFNTAVDSLQKSARNLEAIQEAKRKREQEDQVFQIEKKQKELELQKAETMGQLDPYKAKLAKFQLQDAIKQYDAINKGKDAQIEMADSQNQANLKQYNDFARSVYQRDPEVQAHVNNTVSGSMGGAMDGFERSLPQRLAIPQGQPSAQPTPTGRVSQPTQTTPSVFDKPVVPTASYDGKDVTLKTPDTKEFYTEQIRQKKARGEQLNPDEQAMWDKEMIGKSQSVMSGATEADIQDVAHGIMTGQIPPDTKEISFRDRTKVNAELQRQGYNLTKAKLEYTAAERFLKTQNGDRITKLRTAQSSVLEAINNLRLLNKDRDATQYQALNSAQLAIRAQTGDTKAAQYISQVQIIRDELGQLFMGGNSPTDKALQMAEETLNKNYSIGQLNSVLDTVDKNISFRMNAMENLSPWGMEGPVTAYGTRDKAETTDQSTGDFSNLW